MKVLCLLAAASLIAFTTSTSGAPRTSGTPGSSAPTLDAFKALEGTWHEIDAEGKRSERPFSTVRTTAGGSAVVETIFVGTEMEMITIYHEEEGRLALTHFCVAGNRPHMLLSDDSSADELLFVCDGRGLDCSADEHMHEARFTRVDADRWKTKWRMIKGDETTHMASFELVRSQE